MSTDASPDLTQEFSINDFADIVASMSRFLTRFSHTDDFKEAEVGLAEWLGLMTIKAKPGLSNKQFAKLLGVTVQRAAQISEALKRAEMISVSQSAMDARMHSMDVTPNGLERLDNLNSKLSPMICSRLGSRASSLARIKKNLNVLLRVVNAPKDAKNLKKVETNAKK